jgi:hypothetical protein
VPLVTEPLAPEPDLATVPATAAAPKASGAARLLWWCVLLMPVTGPVFFLLPPLFVIGAGCAFVVAVDAITDRGVPAAQRRHALLLSAALLPSAILGMFLAGPITATGIDPRTTLERLLPLAAIPVWVLLLLRVKPHVWKITKKSEWKP